MIYYRFVFMCCHWKLNEKSWLFPKCVFFLRNTSMAQRNDSDGLFSWMELRQSCRLINQVQGTLKPCWRFRKNTDLSNSDPPCCASCGNIVEEEEAMGFKNKPASCIRMKPFLTLCAGKGYNRVVEIYWAKPVFPKPNTHFNTFRFFVKSCFLEFVHLTFHFPISADSNSTNRSWKRLVPKPIFLLLFTGLAEGSF